MPHTIMILLHTRKLSKFDACEVVCESNDGKMETVYEGGSLSTQSLVTKLGRVKFNTRTI